MAKYCGKCGTRLDEITGLCPKCDRQPSMPPTYEVSNYETEQSVEPIQEPTRKKKHGIEHFFLKFIAAILGFAVLTSGAIGLLVYFGIVEIPLLKERPEKFERQRENESTERTDSATLDVMESQETQNNGTLVQERKTLSITVIHGDTTEREFVIHTEAEYLSEALLENAIVEDNRTQWGLYIVTADSETADERKSQWWQLTKNGETLYTGVDDTLISDGDHYELTLMEDKNVDTEFVIGICQFVQHELLDAATQGFQDAISDLIGNSVTFSVVNAGGDEAQCDEAMADFVT